MSLLLVFNHPCLLAVSQKCVQVYGVCVSGSVQAVCYYFCALLLWGRDPRHSFKVPNVASLWSACRLDALSTFLFVFFFWFSFFHNKPIGQVMVALPRRTFSGSHKFQNSLCALLKDLVGGGSSALGCFWLFLLFDFYLIDGIRDVLRLNN